MLNYPLTFSIKEVIVMDNAKILCAIDFSNVCEQIAAHAAQQARCSGAEVTLVYATPSLLQQYAEAELPHEYFQKIEAGQVRRAEQGMKDLIAKYFPDGKADFIIEQGDPTDVILDVAREKNAGMIIVGTNGHRGIQEFVLGSVADRVIKHSPIPVLSVRPCTKTM